MAPIRDAASTASSTPAAATSPSVRPVWPARSGTLPRPSVTTTSHASAGPVPCLRSSRRSACAASSTPWASGVARPARRCSAAGTRGSRTPRAVKEPARSSSAASAAPTSITWTVARLVYAHCRKGARTSGQFPSPARQVWSRSSTRTRSGAAARTLLCRSTGETVNRSVRRARWCTAASRTVRTWAMSRRSVARRVPITVPRVETGPVVRRRGPLSGTASRTTAGSSSG